MDPRKKVKYQEELDENEYQQFNEQEDDNYNKQREIYQEEQEEIPFNSNILKQIIISLERNYKINQELRMKYPNQPDKFIDSEVDLDEDIKQLQSLPAYPELYQIFYNNNAIVITIQLLLHQNQDIVDDVIQFFKDFVSPDGDVQPKMIIELYDCLVKNYFIESLSELILKNQEKSQEEVNQLHDCFEIIENMIEIKQSICKEFGQRSKLLQFLVKRLEDDSQAIDDNRLYASELLSILTTQSEENIEIIARSGGIESLLIVLSQYKKKEPETAEEKEIINNIFDLLTIILIKEEYQEYFQIFEGIQLMIKLIQGKTTLSFKAYKIILLAINNHKKNCQELIKVGGLSIIFPILQKKGLKSNDINKQFEIDDTTVQIIKQLFKLCHDEEIRKRLINKCQERISDFKKLRQQYVDIIPLIDPEEYDQLNENQLEKIYYDLLGKGLIVIEQIDIILLELIYEKIEIDIDKREIYCSVNQMLKYSDSNDEKQYYQNLLKCLNIENE